MKTSDSSTIYNSINGLSESTIHDNTKQDVVIITKDRLKLKLGDFRDSVEDKYRAVTFGGIAITLLIAKRCARAISRRLVCDVCFIIYFFFSCHDMLIYKICYLTEKSKHRRSLS